MNETVYTRCQGDEGAELGKPGNGADIGLTLREVFNRRVPGILERFLDGQVDPVIFPVQALDDGLNLLADLIGFLEVIDPAPANFGYGNQPIDAADIDEQAEGPDGGDGSFDGVALFQNFLQFLFFQFSFFFLQQSGRKDDVPAARLEFGDQKAHVSFEVGFGGVLDSPQAHL